MSHFIVSKGLSILVKLGMVGRIGAGHNIEIWMGVETRVCEPFHRKNPNHTCGRVHKFLSARQRLASKLGGFQEPL